MSNEVIHEITEQDLMGITSQSKPIYDHKGSIMALETVPMAIIKVDNELIAARVEHIRFVDPEETTGNVWHVGEGHSDDVDTRIDIFSEHLDEHVPTREDIIADEMKRHASGIIGSEVGCECNHLGKGFKEIRLVWRD